LLLEAVGNFLRTHRHDAPVTIAPMPQSQPHFVLGFYIVRWVGGAASGAFFNLLNH
jgi:hypothetical protein